MATTNTVRKRKPKAEKVEKNFSQELLEIIKAVLEDGKAENIVEIDLKDKTDIADFMIIASGTSQRQVSALADHISEKLKKSGIIPKIEGKDKADWVLVDAGDVIAHIFKPEVREYYNIEKMWGMAASLRSNE